ncbi:MAG: type I-E CRISPR-associated protein Cas7/Cse4/CasC [Proteobacteria bacterium]|nr:type I-E CRISPR-associated protein Cas7/Cse4/CasC [Pseudomonadota bacterium]
MVAEPTGKQNSFAAHNPPEFAAMSVCRDAAPRTANAFEIAVRAKPGESLTRKSTEALVAKAGELGVRPTRAKAKLTCSTRHCRRR